jgi:hypothetical protein
MAEVVTERLVGYNASTWGAQQVSMFWQIGDNVWHFRFCRLSIISK